MRVILPLHVAAAAAALALFGGVASTAHAQALNVGTTLSPVQDEEFSDTVGSLNLFASSTANYAGVSGQQSITGLLRSAVYGNGATSETSTSLFFVYQLTNDDSTTTVTDFRLNGFLNANITDADEDADTDDAAFGIFTARSAGAGTGAQLTRPEFTDPSGNAVFYTFAAPRLPSGTSSSVLALQVAGGGFVASGNASVNGAAGVSANTSGIVFTPAAAAATVPEPGTVGLLSIGLLGMVWGGAVARRRGATLR